MNLLKKILSFITILILTISVFSGTVFVYASEYTSSNSELRLTAQRNENFISVNLETVKDMTFGGLDVRLYYDDSKVIPYNRTNSDTACWTSPLSNVQYNNKTDKFSMSTGETVKTSDGFSILSVKYELVDNFKADTDYTFDFAIESLFNENEVDYINNDCRLSITYREHTVSFNLNGGDSSKIENQYVVTGKKASKPEDPTRTGYTFAGWKKGDTNFNFDTPITEKTELVAQWTANPKVTYTINGEAPSGYVGLRVPTAYAAGDVVTVAENLTTTETTSNGVPGKWTFNGWTVPDNITVTTNSEDTKTFTMPESDVTITGTWTFTPDTYTVTWKNGDETLEEDKNEGYNSVPSYDGTAPTKTSPGHTYTFAGWGTSPTDSAPKEAGNLPKVTADATYYAIFTDTVNSHNVTYSISGDIPEDYTAPESQSVKYGTEVTVGTVPQPQTGTKGGINGTFTFEGWTSPEGITVDNGTFSMPDNDVTFTGVWTFTPDKYTVTFDSDGGNTVNPQEITSGSQASKPADPTKDGYTFKDWTLNGQPYDFTSPVTGNITLKASWTANAGYTVDTKKEKHTYEIYQIFTGDYTQVTEGEGDDAVTKDVLPNLVWGQNAPEGKTGPVSDEVVQALNKAAGRELDKDKLTEIEKVVDLNSTPIKKVSADGDDPVSVDLPGGYYLIRDVPDSQSGKNDAYTTYITVVVKDYTITPKSALPTIDKQVADDDNSKDGTSEDKNSTNKNPDTTWGESADHAINESFQFKLIATIPAPASGEYNRFDDYKTYKLIFHDTMSKGVTFDSIASVKVNNADVPDSGYTKSEIVTGDGGAQTWSLTIPDVKKYDDLKDGATVTVIYNAHLNKDAIVHNASADPTETNKNSVYLEYSNNPNTGYEADLGKTESDTVWVFTYKVENIKKADSENGEALPNAGFTLYDSESNAIKLINNNDGTYTVADQTKNSGTITEMKSGTDGKFTVIGLDAGNYTLKETSTPSGYNTCDDTTIKIDAAHKETDDTAKAGLTLSNDSTMANTIINKSGAILPSTGGIGTTIFYILGSVLVIGAGIILVSRKRMEV